MTIPFDWVSVDETTRLAAAGLLLALARADGVVDDEELLPLVAELDVASLSGPARRELAGWVLGAVPIERCLDGLRDASPALRAGLLLRMVELAGADEAVAPGEVARLAQVARQLDIDDDQLGAMKAFVLDVERALDRTAGPARDRLLEGAGEALVAAGVPVGAVALSEGARRLGADADRMAAGLGLLPEGGVSPLLGDRGARERAVAWEGERLREGLAALVDAMGDDLTGPARLRRNALERRLRALGRG